MTAPEFKKIKASIRFSGNLARDEGRKKVEACVLALPKSASDKLGTQDEVAIEGTLNGFPFRKVLEPDGNGSHRLIVNEAMLGGAGAEVGDTVTVEITRVGDEPDIRPPTELRKALAETPPSQEIWEKITPMARRDWILWICSGKLEETRLIRIGKACDMLASGKKRVCCFGGLNWLLKDHGTSGGVWQELPKAKKME